MRLCALLKVGHRALTEWPLCALPCGSSMTAKGQQYALRDATPNGSVAPSAAVRAVAPHEKVRPDADLRGSIMEASDPPTLRSGRSG